MSSQAMRKPGLTRRQHNSALLDSLRAPNADTPDGIPIHFHLQFISNLEPISTVHVGDGQHQNNPTTTQLNGLDVIQLHAPDGRHVVVDHIEVLADLAAPYVQVITCDVTLSVGPELLKDRVSPVVMLGVYLFEKPNSESQMALNLNHPNIVPAKQGDSVNGVNVPPGISRVGFAPIGNMLWLIFVSERNYLSIKLDGGLKKKVG
ncbi:hypothetical protein Acr_07g0003870 [Actinidia rufa]|uniref:Uncharacterized protein n=1 Tax=Actinidia rufa TaxID=165716 RepID=A0A7J0EUZ7_9ERIC|nr:hypothetical protein Acr_07g0003870 [Actinidia rufa]